MRRCYQLAAWARTSATATIGAVSARSTLAPKPIDKNPALAVKATHTGNPVRPMVILAATRPYSPPEPGGPLHLLVFGGSQGARVMSEIVPAAVERLEPRLQMRIKVVQQAREEDLANVRQAYVRLRVNAECLPASR